MNADADLTIKTVPDHVPPELVFEYDFKKDLVDIDDSYVEFAKLLDRPDIFYTPCQAGHWVLTRFEDIEHFFMNSAGNLSSLNALIPKGARPMKILPLESDPPLTADYRQILMPFFTPKAIAKIEGEIVELTRELINGMLPNGRCEFMSEFAQKLPIGIFMRLVNLPDSDVPELLEYCKGFFHGQTPEEQMAGTEKMVGYVARKLQERAQDPGDDMLSAILKGTVEGGRPLSEVEMLGMATVTLLGGLDTIASTFGWIAKFLAENPDHRRQLIDDPSLINHALEEIMRRYHIGSLAREVKNDFEYKGVHFKEGDMVLLPTIIAGLDDRQYDNPWEVDFQREDPKHIVFGRGPHSCLGARLGRFELRTFIAEWLKAIPEFRVAPDFTPQYITGITHALATLPLEWDVKD